MATVRLNINGCDVDAEAGISLLEAARAAEHYIPSLCHHPNLAPSPGTLPNLPIVHRGAEVQCKGPNEVPYAGCGLCWVELEGRAAPVRACETVVAEGMALRTDSDALEQVRREHLKSILAHHPHACILCPLREGCDRRTCSMGVPLEERCCDIFNHCQIRFVSEYVGIAPDTPKYSYKAHPVIEDEPLLEFNWNLCIGCTRCVRVCRDVRGIEALGFVVDENGQLTVGTKGPTLDESGCIFCGACLVVCPSGAILDKEGKKTRDAERPVPCTDACPAGIDIPRYLRFIAEGKFSQALAVVREKVPLPGVLGYVCHHPCEQRCRRDDFNEAISICRLKRFIFERDDGAWKRFSNVKPDTGKRVAIVGSGPAGLTVAYYLRKQGHAVTVFEALPQAGGMLRYGMPPFRLARDVLDGEIAEIEATGVRIQTGSPVESIDALFEEGFHAVFLGIGAHRERKLGIPGEGLALSGIAFLRRVNLGEQNSIGKRVAVIGGGNVAADVARTAVRLGASDVSILYRRTREWMPALAEEIEHALEEGVQLLELTLPLRLEQTSEGLSLTCVNTQLKMTDGVTTSVEKIPNSEFELEFDAVITAIGQVPEVPETFRVALGDDAGIQVDVETLATDRAGVFAGGDAVSGSASVIEAIALGRRATQAIDRYLGGDGDIEEKLLDEEVEQRSKVIDSFFQQLRVDAGCLELERRLVGIEPVVQHGFSETQARFEASRCLRCDLREKLGSIPLPPRRAERLKPLNPDEVNAVPEAEGVYRLYDEAQEVVAIKGVPELRSALQEQLESGAAFFAFEADAMYTQRESELLQQYLQQHGKMPGGELDELDDLF